MPVVIDEVVISVEITNQDSGGVASSSSVPLEKQNIIDECVERILDILQQKAER
jgi:hypothetical protein